jgi:hypothetical protein
MQTNSETTPGNTGDHMKHPSREEWMEWIYGEVSRTEQARLAAHLKDCAECRAGVEQWQGAMKALDEWKAAPVRSRTWAPQRIVKWGIAAALILTAGFGAGRLVSPAAADPAALRASLKKEILAELQQQQEQQLAEFKTAADERREADNKVIFTAIAKVEADRVADYAALHKDLETVAVLTERGFNQAQEQLVTLANYTQPAGNSPNR